MHPAPLIIAWIVGGVGLVAVLVLRGVKVPVRQFSLRTLLIFVLLCAVWMSQLTVRAIPSGDEFRFSWQDGLTVALAWCLLAVFYVRRGLFAALVIHSLGLAYFTILVWICRSYSEAVAHLVAGGLVGSFLSFPFSILMSLGFLRRRDKSPGQAADGNDSRRDDV